MGVRVWWLIVCVCMRPSVLPVRPSVRQGLRLIYPIIEHHQRPPHPTGQLKALLAVRIAERFHGTDNEVQQLRQGLGAWRGCICMYVYIYIYLQVWLCDRLIHGHTIPTLTTTPTLPKT